jgi:hypothetical protein
MKGGGGEGEEDEEEEEDYHDKHKCYIFIQFERNLQAT